MLVRWILRGLAAAAVIAAAFATWVYVASEKHFRSFERPPAFAFAVPTDGAAIVRGEHLVLTRGCSGCHGEDYAGELMWETALAPNLAEYAHRESPATFEAALRHAIGHDGRALYSMPSYNFIRLRDADVADIVAYLRAVPVVQKELPRASLPWSVRLDIARGKDFAIPRVLDRVPELQYVDDPDPALARGEYLAMTTCNECHGFSLRADSPWGDETAPDLLIVMAYDEPAFKRLMRTGVPLGGRELEMMGPVARDRFIHFTNAEVADLYAFLRHMGERASR